jgi:hypothetical protein
MKQVALNRKDTGSKSNCNKIENMGNSYLTKGCDTLRLEFFGTGVTTAVHHDTGANQQ